MLYRPRQANDPAGAALAPTARSVSDDLGWLFLLIVGMVVMENHANNVVHRVMELTGLPYDALSWLNNAVWIFWIVVSVVAWFGIPYARSRLMTRWGLN